MDRSGSEGNHPKGRPSGGECVWTGNHHERFPGIVGRKDRSRTPMREPHVDWLLYRMECAPTTSFENPPAIEVETPDFRLTLRDAIAKFDLKKHHPTTEQARISVAPFLRAWEIDAGLSTRPGEIRFVYERSGVSDRNPPQPGEAQIIGAQGIASGEAFGIGTLTVSHSAYPEPPISFKLTPTVETLWQRYEGYVAGREPLSSMAYFCLTVIESGVGQKAKRRSAANRHNIGYDVLCKLGELTERRGDPMTARKMDSNLVPHTRKEIQWIEAAVKAVIRRVAQVSADAPVNQITMRDLPAL